MALCTHLDGAKRCTDDPAPGDRVVCICKSSDGTRIWPRIRNVHDAGHATLTKTSETPPPGVEAVYELQHNSASTQSGTVDGDRIPWSGNAVTLHIRHSVDGVSEIYSLMMEQPEGC